MILARRRMRAAGVFDAEALRVAVNARVARFKRIEQLELVAADALPRTPLGKVLKRELRDEIPTDAWWDAEASGISYEKR